MKLTDLVIDTTRTLGRKSLLTEVAPVYAFENGHRTDDIIAYKYDVVFPDAGFEKISIKIEGKKQIEAPAQGYTEVLLEGLDIFIYWRCGEYAIGARANAIKVKS